MTDRELKSKIEEARRSISDAQDALIAVKDDQGILKYSSSDALVIQAQAQLAACMHMLYHAKERIPSP